MMRVWFDPPIDNLESSMVRCFAPDADFEALKGPLVGQPGQTRAAYEVVGNSTWVIKEALYSHEANWTEFIIFRSLDGAELQTMFGECIAISQTGRFLIMERLDDLTADQLPLRPPVPTWFTDRKVSAWGARSTSELAKIRDYGTLALGRWLPQAPRTALPSAAETAGMRGLIDLINASGDDR